MGHHLKEWRSDQAYPLRNRPNQEFKLAGMNKSQPRDLVASQRQQFCFDKQVRGSANAYEPQWTRPTSLNRDLFQ